MTLHDDLNLAASLYEQLAAKIPPERKAQGRRTPPASRPPLQVNPVSHMADLESFLGWWITTARWILNPVTKVELTRREGVRCPHCGADLIAWLHTDSDRSEIVCTNPDPQHDGTRRWPPSEWPRLGVLAGVHIDGRYGPRLRAVGEG